MLEIKDETKMIDGNGLKIEKLRVELQGTEILHGIDLHVNRGDFISLLGPSGCGKTTLLKSIAGLLDVKDGSICLDEKVLNQMAPEKRGTVIVFQDLRLFPHMTVEKNIQFAMNLQKVDKKTQKETVSRLLKEVRLEGFEKRKIRELSGGQQQRIAIARALAANPDILLLDEPFSGLDERLREEMGELVKRLQRELKITMILVTHDKREALQMSDKIALMLNGNIAQFDEPKQLFYHPKTKDVAEYFGKANYFCGKLSNQKFSAGKITVEAEVEDGTYEAMVRPGAIRLIPGDAYRIEEIVFMGDTAECILREVSTGETKEAHTESIISEEQTENSKKLIASCATKWLDEQMYKEGDQVDIAVDTENVCLFATEN